MPRRFAWVRSSPPTGTPSSDIAGKIAEAAEWLREMNIGGTAVGTGINAEPEYPELMVRQLQQISGLQLRVGQDRVQLMQSMGDIATVSGALRAYVLDLNKIANDIRLLASGPRTGLAEILLPAVQPGSSIMPGKVNPSIAEMVNQVCYQALGLDTTVALAAEAGQLELNVMMPVMAHNIVFTLIIVGNASAVLAERCVDGIEADEAQCAYWLERSPALVTALAPKIGYAEAAKLAKEAVASGLTVRELVVKKGLLKGQGAGGGAGPARHDRAGGARRERASCSGQALRSVARRSGVTPGALLAAFAAAADRELHHAKGGPVRESSAATAPSRRCRPARRPSFGPR